MLKVELCYSRHSSQPPAAPTPTLKIDIVIIKYIHLDSGYLELTEISLAITLDLYCTALAELTHDATHNNLLVKSVSEFSFMLQ